MFSYFEYIFIFLPPVLAVYFLLNHRGFTRAGQIFLLAASLCFYGLWNLVYLPLLLLSIVANFGIGRVLSDPPASLGAIPKKAVVASGICFNVALLGYFKYSDFFIQNINAMTGSDIGLLKIAAPLGISYYTFLQVAFLVDTYRGRLGRNDFIPYALFVSFFPKISQGPIALQGEMVPQFADRAKALFNSENFARGMLLVAIGLFKKLVIADNLGVWASQGYDHAQVLPLFEAWFTMLAYCFQLYFDFCGYTDMAIGVGYMFNIRVPDNFLSPYKSLNYQELWRRWHITLGRFLREYIYIPLGGNRHGEIRTYLNLLITFLVGGLWHGAAWTFVLWGAMNGVGLMVHRLWKKTGIRMHWFIAWFLTFMYWNITVVMWRATSYREAIKIYRGLIGLDGVMLPAGWAKFGFLKSLGVTFGPWLANLGGEKQSYYIYLIIAAAALTFFAKNSIEMSERLKPNMRWALFTALLLGISIIHLTQVSQFIYANF
ncbi:MAG TPA: MBOAT family O-acyltransferase [Spirochaetota bacterium]|jgi:D-alanyl-lipoteichoic acid acyltransferase DltB (MBOAT superfamily)|nr:MBOAT family O-acyltransferase [Spirochaetota bacterium]HPV42252.1 MBOAT family O-acyltransferase [Spirochaetota bacterium]